MKKILSIFILSLVFSLTILAQENPKVFAVKTENGVAVCYNNGNKTFAFEIFGKEIKPQNTSPGLMLFVVDGKVFQVNFPKLADILEGKKMTDEKEILKAHQKWEIDFQSESVFKQKLIAENEDTIFLNLPKGESKQTFFWTYKRPEGNANDQFVGDAFQSTLIGDTVLVIGSPLAPNQDLRERRQYFNATLSTLMFFDKEISPDATKPTTTKPKAKTTKKTKVKG